MGPVEVPVDALWRAQTQRAIDNFPISGSVLERELIAGLAMIKGAGARVRARRGRLDPEKAKAIAAAAEEVVRGDHDDHFPLDVFQTGSGTSSNMNMNEVLATLAARTLGGGATVHPNDDVNDPLSSNDQFPSAIHIAATRAVLQDLVPSLEHLAEAARLSGARIGVPRMYVGADPDAGTATDGGIGGSTGQPIETDATPERSRYKLTRGRDRSSPSRRAAARR